MDVWQSSCPRYWRASGKSLEAPLFYGCPSSIFCPRQNADVDHELNVTCRTMKR